MVLERCQLTLQCAVDIPQKDKIGLRGHPSQTLATETLLYDVYEPQKKGCEQAVNKPIRRLFF